MLIKRSKEIIQDIQDNEKIEVIKDATGKTIAIPLRQCKKLLEKWRKEDMEIKNYKNLIGKYIIESREDEEYFYFITKDNYKIAIEKFVAYCGCNVGEYIDEITIDGNCFGIITNIEEKIKYGFVDEEVSEIVYKGNVTFYFENGKINMKVHGEDNGYYGVSFTMPVEIYKLDKGVNENE